MPQLSLQLVANILDGSTPPPSEFEGIDHAYESLLRVEYDLYISGKIPASDNFLFGCDLLTELKTVLNKICCTYKCLKLASLPPIVTGLIKTLIDDMSGSKFILESIEIKNSTGFMAIKPRYVAVIDDDDDYDFGETVVEEEASSKDPEFQDAAAVQIGRFQVAEEEVRNDYFNTLPVSATSSGTLATDSQQAPALSDKLVDTSLSSTATITQTLAPSSVSQLEEEPPQQPILTRALSDASDEDAFFDQEEETLSQSEISQAKWYDEIIGNLKNFFSDSTRMDPSLVWKFPELDPVNLIKVDTAPSLTKSVTLPQRPSATKENTLALLKHYYPLLLNIITYYQAKTEAMSSSLTHVLASPRANASPRNRLSLSSSLTRRFGSPLVTPDPTKQISFERGIFLARLNDAKQWRDFLQKQLKDLQHDAADLRRSQLFMSTSQGSLPTIDPALLSRPATPAPSS
jgi:hypothetical protein